LPERRGDGGLFGLDGAEPGLRADRAEVGVEDTDLVGLGVGECGAGDLGAERFGDRVHVGHEGLVEGVLGAAQVGVEGAPVDPQDRVGAARQQMPIHGLVPLHTVTERGRVAHSSSPIFS
jgi:hypothetical protein